MYGMDDFYYFNEFLECLEFYIQILFLCGCHCLTYKYHKLEIMNLT